MNPPRAARSLLLLCTLLLGAVSALQAAPWQGSAPATATAGENIYRFGLLPTGKPLLGERESGLPVAGAAAACVNCHRRSGLGAAEGRGFIPPITSQFLFHPRSSGVDDSNLPYVDGARINRDPYTADTLARAIRSGIAQDGRPLSVLMPHYLLGDTELSALVAYLRQLTKTKVPGVSESALQFATIITPDADPVKSKAMLSVLNDYFDEKNASARAVSPRLHSYHKMMFRATRQWQLHIWQLRGPADTWEAQLQQAPGRRAGVRRAVRNGWTELGPGTSLLRDGRAALFVPECGAASGCGKRFSLALFFQRRAAGSWPGGP